MTSYKMTIETDMNSSRIIEKLKESVLPREAFVPYVTMNRLIGEVNNSDFKLVRMSGYRRHVPALITGKIYENKIDVKFKIDLRMIVIPVTVFVLFIMYFLNEHKDKYTLSGIMPVFVTVIFFLVIKIYLDFKSDVNEGKTIFKNLFEKRQD